MRVPLGARALPVVCRWGDDMAGRHGGSAAQMAETHWYMEAMYSSVMAVSAA